MMSHNIRKLSELVKRRGQFWSLVIKSVISDLKTIKKIEMRPAINPS